MGLNRLASEMESCVMCLKKYITSNYILKRIKERKAFCFGQLKGEINLMKRNPFTMKRLKG